MVELGESGMCGSEQLFLLIDCTYSQGNMGQWDLNNSLNKQEEEETKTKSEMKISKT